MPSPFPGMDPYLEARSVWPDVHASLITYIRETLQPQVRPKYIARIGERVQLAHISRSYVPDILLVRTLREPAPTLTVDAPLVADEPQLVATLDEAVREPYIEIVARDTGDVVTLIELLSPANKIGDGRSQYIQKQNDLLATDVNLVEIDLLGYGQETVLARNTLITEPADWRYLINASRAEQRNILELYAVPLRTRLPNCRIPLRPPDADAVLDLTAVLNRSYDVGGYDLLVDYNQPPSTPLRDDELAWMNAMLQEKGLKR
ncbi:MAG: DUF4058 family protein [Chloroflexi bacterium]|nr:DUF4058 family protein [Chloroflexota bacterium]